MENQRKIAICERLSVAHVQLFTLLAAGLVLFVLMIGSDGVYRFVDNYVPILPVLFLGTALAQKVPRSVKRQLLLCLFMVVWFVLVQTQHELFGMNTPPVGFFLCSYLLAFPFAALTQDGERQKGLKMVAAIYIAASLTMVAYAALLLLDRLPNFLKSPTSINGVRLLTNIVSWDGARLSALWHPNIGANFFIVGIAFTLGFSFRTKRSWAKCLLWAASALQFMALSLTNSRTAILLTCAFAAGLLFFRICKGGWKRVIASMIAALAVMIGLFSAASALYDLHYDRLAAKYAAEAAAASAEDAASVPQAADAQSTAAIESAVEEKMKSSTYQGSILTDFRSLNGRTAIWQSALRAVRENPSVLIWGTDSPGALVSQYCPFYVSHSHNSWTEVLLALGLPGLLVALAFTWSALRSAFVMLFRQHDMWKKSVALLALCLLAVGFMEPYLFFAHRYTPFFDFIFFLCIGYMSQWRRPQVCGTAE